MGNWLNKEWSQLDSGDEKKPSNLKPRAKVLKKKSFSNYLNSSNSSENENERKGTLENSQNSTPLNLNNKFSLMGFDPRSPTNGIVR
jgi:hypothetical protein